MKLTAKNYEIRGSEVKESQATGNPYIAIRVEDETGEQGMLVDHNMDNASYYKRGTIADFVLDLRISKKFTSLSVAQLIIKTDH